MADPVVPDIGATALNKIELEVFHATLVEVAALIKRISPHGAPPYTKIAVPAPQTGGQ